jgi:hypothetical protein
VRPLVDAVGGTRQVPAPDPIARDYLLLALRLDQHRPGLVDGYYGPADLKLAADTESLPSPARLADEAVRLQARLPDEVPDPGRRAWLAAQLVALETQAREAAGEVLPYEDLVARLFDHRMPRVDDAIFDTAAASLDALVPGTDPLEDRLNAWDAGLLVPVDRVAAVADHLRESFRARAAAAFGLPAGEEARIELVRDRPWTGYNWYLGGGRSRVELNLDLPIRIGDLIHTVAHETYPGHHLEASTKEAELVNGQARLEISLLSINTPECLMHEGLADLGYRFAVPPPDEAAVIEEAIGVAGLPVADDPVALHRVAAIQTAVGRARRILRGVGGNAALLRHAEGRSHTEVVDYLVTVGRNTPERAEHRLRFIEDPLWRAYVFVYREGEALMGRWLDAAPEEDRSGRFRRLLAEAIAPSTIAAELRD